MHKKRIVCLLAAFALLVLSTGCQRVQEGAVEYNTHEDAVSIPSQTVASNSEYELQWDDDAKCVLLKCLATGKIWSNIPYENLQTGNTNTNINSTLNITVVDPLTLGKKPARSYKEVNINGRLFSEKIENGIRVTYCFDNYQIAIPVNYVLRQDSMIVTIDAPAIVEGSKYLLLSVSLAPFLCSAQNKPNDAYLFIPSGSGALMYATKKSEGIREYTGEVYGADAVRPDIRTTSNQEPVRLNVFGAKDGNSALLGILEEGAGSAVINATAGNNTTGYSNIYPDFYFRGYDVFGKVENVSKDLTRYSETLSRNAVSVGYYPLSGDEADYNGMAKRYREYLEDSSTLIKNKTKEDSPYSVTLLGGVLTTSSILGIPTKTVKPMTTFAQTKNIIEELADSNGVNPTARLTGFMDGGISPGKIAGGYNFSSIFGGDKKRKELEAFCADKNISLFTDFDIIRYSESGAGFSFGRDSAKTAILKTAEQYPITTPNRRYNKNMPYHLLKRGKLSKAVNMLLDISNRLSISGISLSSLGSVAYSDYSDDAYAVKGKIESDVRGMIEKTRAADHLVATGSNAYAAAAADLVYDVPMEDGGYDAFDEQIPFYQIVFHGFKSLYSPSINLAAEPEKQIMLAAIGGTGLGFTLINDFDVSFMEIEAEKLYGAVYKNNISLINQAVDDYKEFYKAVSGAAIEKYEILSPGVSKTVFSNGVALYADHTTYEWSVVYGE